jgi:hypothetical protein
MSKRKSSIDDNRLADDAKKLRIVDVQHPKLPSSFVISTMSDSALQEKLYVENHYRDINSTLALLNHKRKS